MAYFLDRRDFSHPFGRLSGVYSTSMLQLGRLTLCGKLCAEVEDGERARYASRGASGDDSKVPSTESSNKAKARAYFDQIGGMDDPSRSRIVADVKARVNQSTFGRCKGSKSIHTCQLLTERKVE